MSSTEWRSGRIVRRTLQLHEHAEIKQTLECLESQTKEWDVTSELQEKEAESYSRIGREKDLKSAKQLADRQVDELWKAWATDTGADW